MSERQERLQTDQRADKALVPNKGTCAYKEAIGPPGSPPVRRQCQPASVDQAEQPQAYIVQLGSQKGL